MIAKETSCIHVATRSWAWLNEALLSKFFGELNWKKNIELCNKLDNNVTNAIFFNETWQLKHQAISSRRKGYFKPIKDFKEAG